MNDPRTTLDGPPFVRQDQDGLWWADCESDFFPGRITHQVNGVWVHDGCRRDTMEGPFRTEDEARRYFGESETFDEG